LDGGGGSEVANERGESFEVIEELISELLFIHIESLETELLGLFLKHVASTERIENLGLDEYFLVLD
jgi:predicted RNase H-like HicB family nuclease